MHQRTAPFLFTLVLLLSACQPSYPNVSTDAVAPEPLHILISEIMAGVQGNNNHEFIELYNSSNVPVDVNGWSLWYQLPTNQEPQEVFRWERQALIPAKGHFILVRAGEEIGATPDEYFTQGLNSSGGSLWLLDANEQRMDALAWGNASGSLGEGAPAPALQNGLALERQPGGDAGNGQDSDDNQLDFSLREDPGPQNVASQPRPGDRSPLILNATLPGEIMPGEDFLLELQLSNHSSTDFQDLQVIVPIPVVFDASPLQPEFDIQGGTAVWKVGRLPADGTLETELELIAPWTYLTIQFNNIHIESPSPEKFIFAETLWTEIRGGTIPVVVARDLVGSEVIVEGVATMYTGGYYAGSGNVKFYLEDGSHGVQVWVPSGEGNLDVPLGARVRVRGLMDVYRGARELVTATPEDVVILSRGTQPEPLSVSIQQLIHDEGTFPGRLVSTQGTATRIEEFNYSYEMDLVDDIGNLLTLYIDKQTDLSAEVFELGRLYRATGILESQDGRVQIYPRIAEDLREVFPPILRLEADAPITIQPNEDVEIIFSVYNNSLEAQSDLELWIDLPPTLRLVRAEEAEFLNNSIRWSLPVIPPGGGEVVRSAIFRTITNQDSILLDSFELHTAVDSSIKPESPVQIFLGDTVPIWAIQWEGISSPFKLKELQTRGVVTGIFPELGGFWIQSVEPDDNPLTSEGLFIAAEELDLQISQGDLIKVQGQVREISSQTQLQLTDAESLQKLASNQPLPPAVALDPPEGTKAMRDYYEKLEGMLTEVSRSAIVVGPSSRFGEYVIVLSKHDKLRFHRGEQTGWLIHVDDGSQIAHNDRSTLPYALSTGDLVSGLRGPLAYTYGNYKIEPLFTPQIEPNSVLLPRIDLPGEPVFSVMSWNVENLFDILDPHPSSPPRPRRAEYDLQLTKVANTLLSAGVPTIAALQEVEHIGILEDLSEHPLLADFGYEAYLIEGTDGRGIDVGYLVRASVVEVLDVRQYPAPEGLTSRPPLMLHINVLVDGEAVEIYLLNNHFTSLAGGESATEPRRTAQAAWNVSIIDQIRSTSPGVGIIVLGDLNSFFHSPPVDTLRQAGLQHVFEWLSGPTEYTYIYEGITQTLDHNLVSPSLFDMIADVIVLHVNADYALPSPGDDSPMRKSDHDPVITIFSP